MSPRLQQNLCTVRYFQGNEEVYTFQTVLIRAGMLEPFGRLLILVERAAD